MRIYKPMYKEKNKQAKRLKKWYVEIRDHMKITRAFPGFTDKKQSAKLGEKLEKLVVCKLNNETPDRDLSVWLEQIPAKLRDRLVKIGLIDIKRAAAGKLLSEHLEDFKKSLLAKRRTKKHVNQTTSRIQRVIEECGFVNWSDITASKVLQTVVKLRDYAVIVKLKKVNGKKIKRKVRKDLGQISAKTANYYIKAVKQFCNWMVEDRRASESPVEHLQSIDSSTHIRHERRTLEPDQLRFLLETTRTQPKRFGMTGPERVMLYRLAVETGFRANELRSLKRSSFDFSNCTVTVEIGHTKNKKEAVLPLKKETVAVLQQFLTGKMPNAKAFKVPEKTADMLKEDLAVANIPYVDDAGRYADFHALRHSTGSLLAAAGVHPKTIQIIMRHSDINLTMSRYTHIFQGQESEAIAKLPDFSQPSKEKQRAIATGTDGKTIPSNIPFLGVQQRVLAGSNEKQNRVNGTEGIENAVFKRGRRDSNAQPSDRQSDALTS